MTLYEDLNTLFTKADKEIQSPPYILNRFLSFSSKTYGIARRLDRYMFHMDKDMISKMMLALVPEMKRAPWMHYIKKPKEKAEEFDFIFKDLQTYYNWTNKKLEVMKPVILKLCDDKETLSRIMNFIGADLKYFKKYKIEIKKPSEAGIGKWFK